LEEKVDLEVRHRTAHVTVPSSHHKASGLPAYPACSRHLIVCASSFTFILHSFHLQSLHNFWSIKNTFSLQFIHCVCIYIHSIHNIHVLYHICTYTLYVHIFKGERFTQKSEEKPEYVICTYWSGKNERVHSLC
jgi:hypothetical protein